MLLGAKLLYNMGTSLHPSEDDSFKIIYSNTFYRFRKIKCDKNTNSQILNMTIKTKRFKKFCFT